MENITDNATEDPFGGSGSTMIACEKTGRQSRLIELDPKYVDTAVIRWQEFTGLEAVLHGDGRTFREVAQERAGAGVTGRVDAPPDSERVSALLPKIPFLRAETHHRRFPTSLRASRPDNDTPRRPDEDGDCRPNPARTHSDFPRIPFGGAKT
jgi:hypothetical protein